MQMQQFITLLLCLLGRVLATSAVKGLNTFNFTGAINDPTNAKPFLVSFIDPECPFSKMLQPVLDDLSTTLPAVLFRTVNCAQESELCAENEVAMYPTVRWYADGMSNTLDCDLDHEGLSSFASELSSAPIKSFSRHGDIFIEGSSEKEVAFVLYTSTEIPKEFERVAMKYRHHSVSFVTLQHNEANEAWIKGITRQRSSTVLVRVERDIAQTKIFRDDFMDINLNVFVSSNLNPVVPEMTVRNQEALLDDYKFLAIGIVDPHSERTRPYLRELRNYVTNALPSIRGQYEFVWVNPKKWGSLLDKLEVRFDGEPIFLVVDLTHGMYWNVQQQNNVSVSTDDISKLLRNIIEGVVPPKSVVSIQNESDSFDSDDFFSRLPFQNELRLWQDYPKVRMFFIFFVILDAILIGASFSPASSKLNRFAENYLWLPADKFIEFITEKPSIGGDQKQDTDKIKEKHE
eukprot:scaffold2293_cov248-Chaetoceros_neogracile.AAC.1